MADVDERMWSKRDAIRLVLRDYRFFHDCLQGGHSADDRRFLELHTSLMPDLEQEVGRARRLMAMHDEADRRKVSIICPNCNERLRVTPDEAGGDVICSVCESTFRVTGDGAQEEVTVIDRGQSADLPRAHGLIPGGYLGEFELNRPVGHGGFGQVWKARDTSLNRTVAIKIATRLNDEDRERFQREAEAAARLQHPNIVEVYRAGELEGRLCIVSRFVDGESLRGALKVDHASEFDQAIEWCQKLASALEHAHQRHIVHRDVKPENVILDAAGEPFLTDFGLARDLTHETVMTRDQAVLGSPAYMSPQQAAGQSHDIDGRTDVYSLGVVLYELLTGFRPFRGSNVQSLIHQIIEVEPIPPRRENIDVPRDLDTICCKCLEKDPDNRYGTAGELADDLQRYLNREPILARPVGPAMRVWRWCQRKPALAGTIGGSTVVVLATVVTAFVLITNALWREQAAHDVAENRRQETLTWLNVAHDSLGSSYLQLGELFSLFPGMKSAYAGFLTAGAAQYERLAAVKSDDPDLETERARVLLILGDIRLELGETTQADEAYRSARDILTKLDATRPTRAVSVELANSQVRLASVAVRNGAFRDASALCQGAIASLTRSLADAPDDTYVRYSLASALLNHGSLLLESDRPAASSVVLAEAVQEFESLVAAAPADSDFLTGLVKALTLLGQYASGAGDHEKSIERISQGLELLSKHEAQFQQNVPLLETRAAGHVYLATVLEAAGRTDAALDEYQRSVASWQALSELAPDVPRYQEQQVLRQVDLAQALHDAGQLDQALTVLPAAQKHIEEMLKRDGNNPRWIYIDGLCLDVFGRVLNHRGDHEHALQYASAARDAFDYLTQAFPDDSDYRVRLGITLHHLGQAQHRLADLTAARQSIEKADAAFRQLLIADPDWFLVRELTAFCARDRGLIALAESDDAGANLAWKSALQSWSKICEQSDSARFRSNYAWFLLEVPDRKLRDANRAMEVAKALTVEVPSNPDFEALLGSTFAAAGRHLDAAMTLESLTKRHPARRARDWFYLAQAQAGLNRNAEAAASLRQGLNLMDRQMPGDVWLQRLRDEMRGLVRIPEE